MPLVRYQPGEAAPWTGTYALTTEWETTGVAIFREKGERLPFVAVAEGLAWYILVGAPGEAAQAA